MVAPLQRYPEPRSHDCQGHNWWKHDETTVYILTLSLFFFFFSCDQFFFSLPFLMHGGRCELLITTWTGGLIEHNRSPISCYSKSRCYLCKLGAVPQGAGDASLDANVTLHASSAHCAPSIPSSRKKEPFMEIIASKWMFLGCVCQTYFLISVYHS